MTCPDTVVSGRNSLKHQLSTLLTAPGPGSDQPHSGVRAEGSVPVGLSISLTDQSTPASRQEMLALHVPDTRPRTEPLGLPVASPPGEEGTRVPFRLLPCPCSLPGDRLTRRGRPNKLAPTEAPRPSRLPRARIADGVWWSWGSAADHTHPIKAAAP